MAKKNEKKFIQVEVMPIEEAATTDLLNTNKHSARGRGREENSMRRRGIFRPIAAAGKGVEMPVIGAGNQTFEIANEIGIKEAIVVHTRGDQILINVRDDVAPGSAEFHALAIEDNVSAQDFIPDLDLIAQLSAQDSGILSETLKQDKVLAGMLEDMGAFGEPPKDAEAQISGGDALAKWNVKEGDLFGLGIHKLLCGDSTKRVDIERLVNDNQYCVLTDPPYNIGFEYNGMDNKMTAQGYADFCKAWFGVVSDAICLIFSPGPKNVRLYPEPRDIGYWLKRYASAGASAFNLRSIEPIMIYGKIGKKRNFDLFDFSSGFPEELRAAQRAALVEDAHPPAKPIGLWIDLLDMLPEGMPVLDCFSGNGTTFMVCQNRGRICYGNERDPSYCALILERFSIAFPNEKIEKL
jgi:hypothetical protein